MLVVIILVAIIVYALLSAGKKKDGSTNQDGTMKETINALNTNGLTPVRMLPVGRTSIVGEYYRQSSIRNAVRGHEREVAPMGVWDNTLMLPKA